MTTLWIGFEASDLQPERGGLYTYASQLLSWLSQLSDAPEITLIDGWGRHTWQELLAVNGGSLPAGQFARSGSLPLLHLAPGNRVDCT